MADNIKRNVAGKIKDFVELQAFDEMRDFFADPGRALAAYRFTDATSDLLARWINTLVDLPHNHGTALALAGLRGCGKSHTLAALSALVSLPHLRSGVTDAHVAASARRLSGRRYILVYVSRGTHETLVRELIAGFGASFGGDAVQWGDDPATILEVACLHAQDATIVIVVDTAYGRAARVNRDDGPMLSELAVAAQHANAFVCLALDDDISGADGINVALAETYQIDYLDPEHIYRIADLYVLRKSAQARTALQEIYARLRASVPNFNWSEHRFTSTYPVHPLVADLTPAVRLYAPTFAFLPFAAAAAEKALARRALSLVVLDEVFDRIEEELRADVNVRDAMTVYDELATQTVTQFPIMQRLQAKLILKGLFVLSLDGRGATARELSAAMLLYEDQDPEAAIKRIAEMLARFAHAAPENSFEKSAYGDDFRYSFNIAGSSGFDTALTKRLAQTSPSLSEIDDALSRRARARFPDWPLVDEDDAPLPAADCSFAWRGSDRPGRLLWQERDQSADGPHPNLQDNLFYDWKLAVLPTGSAAEHEIIRSGYDIWAPAQPSAEESDVLRRLVALRSDESLYAQYGETARAAEAMLVARAELIWIRLYVEEAALIIGGVKQQFNAAARGAPTLSETLAQMYATVMEERYPQHPAFHARLDEEEVTNLLGGFFVGSYITDPASQRLAGLFAAPLGLTTTHDNLLMPEGGNHMLAQPWVRVVLDLTNASSAEAEASKEPGAADVSLDRIFHQLRESPYGLLRETQQLILGALVAQRRIEFVLATGERGGRRALEGPLPWDEITGVRRSTAIIQGAEELTLWAQRLTGQMHLPVLSDTDSRDIIRAALHDWLQRWHVSRLLPRFEELPDQGLTTRVATLAASVRKSFGAAAHAIEAILADHISLDEGLQRISDAFGGAEETFAHNLQQTAALSEFLAELGQWLKTRDYLLLAEYTAVAEIEDIRRELLALSDDVHLLFDPEQRRRYRLLWQEFQARYVDVFSRAHERSVGGDETQRMIDSLINTDEWREFEMLSQGLSLVNKKYWREAEALLARAREAHCELPVRQLLAVRPFCNCQFRLARAAEAARLVEELGFVVGRGLDAHRHRLELWSRPLARALAELVNTDGGSDEGGATTDAQHASPASSSSLSATAQRLISFFDRGEIPPQLTNREMRLIERALQQAALPPVRVSLPSNSYGLLTRQELQERLQQWIEELPEHPALVEIIPERESHAD